MKAAVMRALREPLAIEDIQIGTPGPREVVVRTAATGVCHSDLHVLDGSLPNPVPIVLGHEPAGVVEAVGSAVAHVAPGDHVIGCLSAFCGSCEYCVGGRPNLCEGEATMRRPGEPPRLAKDGEPIAQFVHLSAFAERMLVHENALAFEEQRRSNTGFWADPVRRVRLIFHDQRRTATERRSQEGRLQGQVWPRSYASGHLGRSGRPGRVLREPA